MGWLILIGCVVALLIFLALLEELRDSIKGEARVDDLERGLDYQEAEWEEMLGSALFPTGDLPPDDLAEIGHQDDAIDATNHE